MKKYYALPLRIFALAVSILFSINGSAQWVQKGIDIDGEAGADYAGSAVSYSADGTTIGVVAFQNDGGGAESGHVRIYSWDGSVWIQKGSDIDGESAGDETNFVSINSDGSIVAVASRLNDGFAGNAGHVRVFEWNGSAWIQKGLDINGEAAFDLSGTEVSLSSDGLIVAISAPANSGYIGQVRIFEWNGSAWVQKGLDIDGEAINDGSGKSVSLSSDGLIVAIGAQGNDGTGTDAGHVRVFEWNGSAWTQKGLDIDGEAANDYSGWSVSISSDGLTVAVGARTNAGSGIDAGHVRIYEWNGSAWIQKGLDIDGEAIYDLSGSSISLSSDGNTVAIGAYGNDGIGVDAGHVRVYEWNGSAWVQKGLDIDGEAANDWSGWSVSMSSSGSSVIVGARNNAGMNGAGSFTGHARVFSFVLAPVSCFTPTPNPVECGQSVAFDGTCSFHQDGAKTIDVYEWDFENDGTADATGSTTSNTFPGVGTYTVELKVTDNVGDQDSTTIVITVNDNTAPTALCQDITIMLDAAGNASIVAADIDGGSTDACGIASLTPSQTTFNCGDITTAPANDMIITGVVDGPLTGGTPKAIEVYVVKNIADLSQYGLGSANNGGGSDGEEFTFPAVAATAGSFIYVTTDAAQFNTFFGFAPDYTSGTAPNINGDDAIELFYQSNVIDVFGDINVDGTGEPWDYLDGWVYRNDNTGPDGSTFVLGNWNYSGINALDGETTNGTAAIPFPIGTFAYPTVFVDPILVTLTVADGQANSDMCVANVTVVDNVGPVPAMISLTDLMDACSVAMPTAPTASDNCAGSIAGVPDVSFPITAPGTTVITWSYDDGNGQVTTQTQNAIISDGTPPTASNPVAVNVVCFSDIPASDISVVTDEADNCTAVPVVAFVSDVSDGSTCPEVITRTYSVTDDAANQIMVTQTITINDVTLPTASNPADVNVSCTAAIPAPDVLDVTDEADNCNPPVVTFVSDVSDGNTCPEVITRTYSVTDDCGNSINVSHIITVSDVTNPVPDVSTLTDHSEECTGTPTAPTATDDCAGTLTGVPDVTFPITAMGTTAVTWTYTDGCGNTTTQMQNVIVSALDTSVTQAGALLTSNSTGSAYQWLDCNNSFATISSETSQAFTATLNGSYAVEVTNGTCVDTSACYDVSGIGIQENGFGQDLSIYPNPTAEELYISLGAVYSEVTLHVRSVSGQLVQSYSFQNAENIELHLTGAPGFYIVEVNAASGQKLVAKVLKQ